jgi:plastocyanin
MLRLIVLFAALLLPVSVRAAPVQLTVTGADGRPLADAVVFIDGPRPAGRPAFPMRAVMAQQDIAFVPHVLIVSVGATVAFPNRDKVRHHVYSFSRPKKFELKLYGKEETRTVTFDQPGLVALGCNIHDSMSGFIWVVDTPLVGQTDAQGRVAIAGVPAGAATLRVWHPTVRAPGNMLLQPVTIGGAGYTGTVTIRR